MENEKAIKVLLVDDEADFVEPIAFWLKSRGYDVSTVANGKEAIERIKAQPLDIAFLDINMPVMDGLQALEQIRSFNKDLPVIMVTAAFSSEAKMKSAQKLGIAGFFAKNYTFDQLVDMIQVTLRTHRKLQSSGGEA